MAVQLKTRAQRKPWYNFFSRGMQQPFPEKDHTPLALKAQDPIDLQVISSLVQDAIIPAANFHYDAKERIFSLLLDRFCWEDSHAILSHQKVYGRILSTLCIQRVEKIQHIDIDRKNINKTYNLLALDINENNEMYFTFSGTARLRLKVDEVSCSLSDRDEIWYTATKPTHREKIPQNRA